ncbi:arsenic resistance N-acetyltransferase ArsN2 [Mucilaginibacter sp. OK283]|jgi:amino-acid N-acetyltransferase|uniref:arsenic resistance N-acetyltransferase ArsN2 n=1 Tax=Mucilaginibacter sp. OK283 TaxID=1881049 RepID=UPI0008CD9D11|nr:arsenic resistance N-acetyltransferase ArsN2 [Mucilaginibacter sp. OK283]SEP25379.1 amino-acid N-acetyltransferase [Mucilaginibacter sp. OK283]
MQIEKAETYRANVIALLAAEKLPTDDLPQTLENFVIALQDEDVIGVAGLEIYDSYCLLRSVAVSAAYRGKGIASRLLDTIEKLAAARQLREIYLLTETAPEYFSKKEYQIITRAQVPAEVQQSTEFSHVCPQSAIVMKKTLKTA